MYFHTSLSERTIVAINAVSGTCTTACPRQKTVWGVALKVPEIFWD